MAVLLKIGLIVFACFFVPTFAPHPGEYKEPDSPDGYVYPSRKLMDPKLFDAPPAVTTGPLCEANKVERRTPDAHSTCTKECLVLSEAATRIFNTFKKDRESARMVHRFCAKFTSGECVNYDLGIFSFIRGKPLVSLCLCHAEDYYNYSFACRKGIPTLRTLVNTKIMAGNMWDVVKSESFSKSSSFSKSPSIKGSPAS